jgi:hypothetical protein
LAKILTNENEVASHWCKKENEFDFVQSTEEGDFLKKDRAVSTKSVLGIALLKK